MGYPQLFHRLSYLLSTAEQCEDVSSLPPGLTNPGALSPQDRGSFVSWRRLLAREQVPVQDIVNKDTKVGMLICKN